MVCAGLEIITDNTIVGLLAFPTSCYYQFYALLMGALFVVLVFGLKATEEARFVKSDTISAMGVSALATIFISVIGTATGIIEPEIFVEIFVIGMVFVVIWLLKK